MNNQMPSPPPSTQPTIGVPYVFKERTPALFDRTMAIKASADLMRRMARFVETKTFHEAQVDFVLRFAAALPAWGNPEEGYRVCLKDGLHLKPKAVEAAVAKILAGK